MKGKYIKGKTIEYDGSQLRPHWALENADVSGDSVVFFRGPFAPAFSTAGDLEGESTAGAMPSEEMVHFIVEYFGCTLSEVVLIQRLLVSVVTDLLAESADPEVGLEREYTDIIAYLPGVDEPGLVSVSSSAISPVSGMIHLGLRVSGESEPPGCCGITDAGIDDVDGFAVEVARRFIEEIKRLKDDMSRVRPVTRRPEGLP